MVDAGLVVWIAASGVPVLVVSRTIDFHAQSPQILILSFLSHVFSARLVYQEIPNNRLTIDKNNMILLCGPSCAIDFHAQPSQIVFLSPFNLRLRPAIKSVAITLTPKCFLGIRYMVFGIRYMGYSMW